MQEPFGNKSCLITRDIPICIKFMLEYPLIVNNIPPLRWNRDDLPGPTPVKSSQFRLDSSVPEMPIRAACGGGKGSRFITTVRHEQVIIKLLVSARIKVGGKTRAYRLREARAGIGNGITKRLIVIRIDRRRERDRW